VTRPGECARGLHQPERPDGACACGLVTVVQSRPRAEQMATVVDLLELTDEERVALPAVHHRPVFDSLSTPRLWHCAVCWGDGWLTGWPCKPAIAGGIELAGALGLECSR